MLCDLPREIDAIENGIIKRRKTIRNLGKSIRDIFPWLIYASNIKLGTAIRKYKAIYKWWNK